MWQQNHDTDSDDAVIITDIDEARPGSARLHTKQLRRLMRIGEGILTAVIALGIIVAWFLPGFYSSSTTPRAGTILFTYHNRTVVYAPLWSHDSKKMAFVDQNGAVYVWNSVTGKLTNMFNLPPLYAGSDQVGEWTWASDNTHLLFATGDGKIRIWNVFTGHIDLAFDTHTSNWPNWTWSHDGKYIAINGRAGTVQIWDISTKQELATLSSQYVQGPGYLEFSPNGRSMAWVSRNRTVEIWDIATGAEVQRLYTPTDQSQGVQQCCNEYVFTVWAPDSKRLAYVRYVSAGKGSVIVVWDALTGRKLLTYSGHTKGAFTLHWSPDSTRIMSASTDEILVWDAATGHTLVHVPGNGPVGGIPALSPDGKLLESSDGIHTVGVWDAVTGRKLFTYQTHNTFLVDGAVVYSPDSKAITVVSTDGLVRVWDATTGQHVYNYSLHSQAIQALLWSPDGRMIGVTGTDGTVAVLQAP